MVDHDPILEAWQAAGTDLVMLPSGIEVRWEQPLVMEMVRDGVLPGYLRNLALQFAGDGVEPDKLQADDKAKWDELVRGLICRAISAARVPAREGAPDQVCASCGRWHTDAPPIPYQLKPEVLAADPPVVPRVDLAAMSDMALRLRTPLQVDALSRVAHGQMTSEAASAIVNAEEASTLAGWARFRHERRGAAAGAERQDVGQPSVQPADHLGSGGRPRARRGDRASTGQPRAAAGRKRRQGGS